MHRASARDNPSPADALHLAVTAKIDALDWPRNRRDSIDELREAR